MRHVVVIGAGVIGASVALRLAQRGVRVTVLDAGRIGGGTSATSFAWIGASHPALDPYLDLNVRGVAAWHALAAELGDPAWLTLPGCLTWSDDPAEQARLDARVPLLQAAGYAARVLDRAEAQALEPDVDLGGARTACLYPDEGWVDAPAMAAAVLAVARGLGATVYEDARVTGLLRRGGRVAGVVLAGGGELAADLVVSCCGRWSAGIAALAGRRLALVGVEEPGSLAVGLLVTTTPTTSPTRMLYVDDLMLRPGGGGRLLLHCDAHDRRVAHDEPTDPPPAPAHDLLDLARARVPGASDAAVESARIGLRALPADHLPALGWLEEGLYLAVTHSGVTLAAALGPLIADEVLEGHASAPLASFRPDRLLS